MQTEHLHEVLCLPHLLWTLLLLSGRRLLGDLLLSPLQILEAKICGLCCPEAHTACISVPPGALKVLLHCTAGGHFICSVDLWHSRRAA
jgi:hypothetical protein